MSPRDLLYGEIQVETLGTRRVSRAKSCKASTSSALVQERLSVNIHNLGDCGLTGCRTRTRKKTIVESLVLGADAWASDGVKTSVSVGLRNESFGNSSDFSVCGGSLGA